MGYLGSLRRHYEALLCDGTGTGHTLAAGRFTRRVDALADPASLAERQLDVRLSPGRPEPIPNPIDLFVYMTHVLSIVVTYARTQGGDDLAEGITAQDGAGTDDALADRADTDAQDIGSVLEWLDNWPVTGGGANGVPEVFDVGQDLASEPTVELAPSRATLTLRYRVRCRTTRTATALAP